MTWEHRWESLRVETRWDWERQAHAQWLSQTLIDYSADGWELVAAVTLPLTFAAFGERHGSGEFTCEVVLFFKRPAG